MTNKSYFSEQDIERIKLSLIKPQKKDEVLKPGYIFAPFKLAFITPMLSKEEEVKINEKFIKQYVELIESKKIEI